MKVQLVREMINQWKSDLLSIQEVLVLKGGESSSLEYNLLSAEALRLSLCINDATECLLLMITGYAERGE